MELVVVGAVDLSFTVADHDQIRVLHVNIDTRDVASLDFRTVEGEEVLESDLVFLDLLIVFLFFFLLFLLGLFATEHFKTALFLVAIFIIVVIDFLLKVHGRVVFVSDVLVMVLGLSE